MPSAASTPLSRRSSARANGKEGSESSADNASASDSEEETSAGEESPEELSSDEEEQKQIYKADITPHHRAEKRPQRRSAAKASHAWSDLAVGSSSSRPKNLTVVEVVIETPTRSSKRERRPPRGWESPEVERAVATPTKIREDVKKAVVTSTPKGKEKSIERVVEEEFIRTPTKKQKVVTPRKKPIPVTPTSAVLKARTLAKQAEELSDRYFIRPTSSDAYFANHAPRSKQRSSKHQTSDNVISGTMPSISSKMIAKLSADISNQLQGGEGANCSLQADHFEPYYDYWWSLLEYTNRPLLVYGIGSKRAQLQHFARQQAKQGRCACIVVRGESGGRTDDVVRELERTIKYVGTSTEQRRLYSTPLEARAHGIVQTLKEGKDLDVAPSILILIHNFDSPLLLQERSLHTLGILSASDRIHLCVDTCHVNSGLIAQLHSDTEQSKLPWLWINMNTYVPMLEEIINERGTGISKAIGLPRVLDIRAAGGGGIGGADDDVLMDEDETFEDDAITSGLLSERAAIQILRSVTVKGRKLFFLLADDLLEKMDAKKTPSMKYSTFAILAERAFLGPEALRAVLVEFTSHGLIRIEGGQEEDNSNDDQNQGMVQTHSGASVSIALSKTILARVYEEFKAA
jgi:hypothetical protein